MSIGSQLLSYFERKVVLPFDDYGKDSRVSKALFIDNYDKDAATRDISAKQQEELLAEAIFVKTELQELERTFFSHRDFYAVSVKWLNIWKGSVFFQDIHSQVAIPADFGRVVVPPLNGDIVVQRAQYLAYEGEQSYMNTFLKPGVVLNSQYILVNGSIWDRLKHYGGNEIRRFMSPSAQGDMVDASLVQFEILYFYNSLFKRIEREQLKLLRTWVQVGKGTTLGEFSAFVKSKVVQQFKNSKYELQKKDFIRVWKLDEQVTLGRWVDSIQKLCKLHKSWYYRLQIQGELLGEPDRTLFDLGVTPETKIIVQIREAKQQWTFFNKTVPIYGLCDKCEVLSTLKHRCSCKVAYYCSKDCKQRNKEFHRYRCETDTLSEEEQKQLRLTDRSRLGRVGLRNLGNTCYMNSGLQCVSHIPQLTDWILSGNYQGDLNLNNPLGSSNASLAKAYCELVKSLHLGEEQVIAPVRFKKEMGTFQPIFAGYGQQDSSQFISYLLDGLHEDLNRVKKKEYVESSDNFNRPDEEMAAQAWNNFRKRNDSIIMDTMYGQYKSRVECNQCPNFSITFDPFLILQLPIPLKRKLFIEFFLSPAPCQLYATKVHYQPKSLPTLRECYLLACKEHRMPPQQQFFAYAVSNYFGQVVDQQASVQSIRKKFKDRKIIILRSFRPGESRVASPEVINVVVTNYKKNTLGRFNLGLLRVVPLNRNQTLRSALLYLLSAYTHIFEGDESQPMEVMGPLIQKGELKINYARPFNVDCIYCKQKCEGCDLPFSQDKLGEIFGNNLQILLTWSESVLKGGRDKAFQMKHGDVTTGQSSKQYLIKKEGGQNQPSTIEDCLNLFQQTQILDEDNKWYCGKCKDFVQARKTMQLFRLPRVMVICLKRFKGNGRLFLTKNNTVVQYPFQNFKIGEFALNKQDKAAEYRLIGVSNHFGGLGGGHYTAYCQDQASGDWYQFDDSTVRRLGKPKEPESQSYVLVYRRT